MSAARAALIAGIAALAAGAAGIAYVQASSDAPASVPLAAGARSGELVARLDAPDTGYFTVRLASHGDAALVRVTGPSGALLAEEVVSARESVNYFDVSESGDHTLAVTLGSPASSGATAELGQLRISSIAYPAAAAAAGTALAAIAACVMIARYITAQPDENAA